MADRPRRIDVIGGGPGGLFLARLVRLRQPSWTVVVHERELDGATFGFGVGFRPSTLDNVRSADPATFDAIERGAVVWRSSGFRIGRDECRIEVEGDVAIGRAVLLAELRRLAVEAGVRLEGDTVSHSALPGDVVVAADGAGSRTRAALADEVGASVRVTPMPYIWCGVEMDLPHTFATAETEAGTFVTHAYPYADGFATFLVEADEATFARTGFEASARPDRGTDEAALHYLADAFADLLGGRPLLGNRSRWQRFRTVRLDRWHHGNVVLLGDAAHTVHYTLASGTKVAMEDAIVLAGALTDVALDDPARAFATYEAARRPSVERLQSLALWSEVWWSTLHARTAMAPAQVFASFFTRTPAVSFAQLGSVSPPLSEAALAAVAGTADRPGGASLAERVLSTPLDDRIQARVVGMAPDPAWRGVDMDRPPSGAAVKGARIDGVDDLTGVNGAQYLEVCEPELARRLRVQRPEVMLVGVVAAPAASPSEPPAEGSWRPFLEAGCDAIRLEGGDDVHAILARAQLGEHLRLVEGATVVLCGPSERIDDLAGAVACGRADLVAVS